MHESHQTVRHWPRFATLGCLGTGAAAAVATAAIVVFGGAPAAAAPQARPDHHQGAHQSTENWDSFRPHFESHGEYQEQGS